jgi:hypothetical protein
MGRHVWAVCAMVLAALASVTVLSVTGAASADVLQVIGTAVIPTVTILLVGARQESQIGQVREQVNGRMSELIARVPPQPTPPNPPENGT